MLLILLCSDKTRKVRVRISVCWDRIPWIMIFYYRLYEFAVSLSDQMKHLFEEIACNTLKNLDGTPNRARHWMRDSGEMQSNAFAQSRAIIIKFISFDAASWSSRRQARKTASKVLRPEQKPYCVSHTRPSAPATLRLDSKMRANNL